MRRDALQRCFFSGKNGVWFRKRTSVKPPVSVSLDAAAVVIGNAVPDGKKCPEALSSVIGWDEVRGRPIYHYSSSLERCELQHVTDDDSRQDLEGSDDEDAPPTLVDHSVLWNDRSRKRKVFGGDRRLRPLSGLLIDATVCGDEKEPLSTDNPNKSSESYLDIKQFKRQSSPPTTTSGAACGGNAEQQSSTFTVQASDQIRTLRRGLRCEESHTGVSERREDSNRQFEFDGDTKLPPKSHKRIKQLSSTRRGRSAPSCDDQNSLHKSLDTARQFFEKLAAQSLTLDTSGTPRQLTKRPCCRTRRARRLSSPNLTAEYGRYAQVCRESGVSPLPKQEYTTNRGEYFRTNELYDGFLDE